MPKQLGSSKNLESTASVSFPKIYYCSHPRRVALLHPWIKALYDDYLWLVASNKQQTGMKLKK